jgi:hypothetical protein
MPPLPMYVTPDPTCAFYLRKHGSAGSEAICYLPAFNDRMRSLYAKKGYRLLNIVSGDFSDKADPLRIQPPPDDEIKAMIVALGSRLGEDGDRINESIAQCKERMDDTEAKERGIYRLRLKGLDREFKSLGKHIPSFEQAKTFFIRVHRQQLRKNIDPRIVAQQMVMAEDQDWGAVQAQLEKDMRVQREESEAVPA